MSDCLTGFLITLGVVFGVACVCTGIHKLCDKNLETFKTGPISGVYNVQPGK